MESLEETIPTQLAVRGKVGHGSAIGAWRRSEGGVGGKCKHDEE
jgi:hypothetical protein